MMMAAATFRQEFATAVTTHLGQELKFGKLSMQARGLEGKFEEGIHARMTLGDIHVLGEESAQPTRTNVEEDKQHYFSDAMLKKTPKNLLLPMLTLTGEMGTDNGCWKLVHETDLTKVWAFCLVLIEKKADKDQTLYLKMLSVVNEVDVLLLSLQPSDVLWEEWKRSQDTGLQDLHFSTDRTSVRYKFMAMLEASLRAEKPGEKIMRKHVWLAFQAAEAAGKFTTAKGMTGITRESDVALIMSFGEKMKQWHLLDAWQNLEVVENGPTPLYRASFANQFAGLVNDNQEEATYVLGVLTRIYLEDPKGTAQLRRAKLLEAGANKMKLIMKTLDLQYLWCQNIIQNCEAQPIQALQKMQVDFDLVKQALDIRYAVNLMEDKSGKKAALHTCAADLVTLILSILVGQDHFNIFMAAVSLNKCFQATCRTSSLNDLGEEGVTNLWKLAAGQFKDELKKAQKEEDGGAPKEEEEELVELPTRSEACHRAALVAVETYVPFLIKSGDPALDRQNIFNMPTAKKGMTAATALWNSDTQGYRRITMYDEAGKRNPKWAYVTGRNPVRSKIGFALEDFEEALDIWSNMAEPVVGAVDKTQKIDVFSVWNVDQAPASKAILKKAASINGVLVKKTTLKGMQSHVERRLWTGAENNKLPEGAENFLEGLPGVTEECFDVFACPMPLRKKHLTVYGGFNDNFYPEEIIQLRNPEKSEPQVTMAVKKQIFPPDCDGAAGSNCLREDEVGTCIT